MNIDFNKINESIARTITAAGKEAS